MSKNVPRFGTPSDFPSAGESKMGEEIAHVD